MDIVGRDAELEIVGRFLDPASEARVLLLTGEAGIGKSTIWQAALTDARARGYRVIGSRPTEAEARLPFAALTDLFGELVDELEPDLPEPQRRALDAALLRASGDGVAEPLAVSLAVLALLRAAIGSGRPLLLAIDDIPWMDGSSAGVLEFALRRLEEEPIRLIAAERTVDASATTLPPVVRAMEHGRLERVIVRGLSVAELERLLGNVLEMELPPSTLKRLHRTSGGNPFYAIEIARAMQRRGKAADQRDLPLPDSLSELIRDRIGALSPAAADVVLHAAALSQPTVGMIETAVGEDVANHGLAEAGEAGVLRVEAGRPPVRASTPGGGGLCPGGCRPAESGAPYRGRAGRRAGGAGEAHGTGGRGAGRRRGGRTRTGGRTRPPARCAGRGRRAHRASGRTYPARRRGRSGASVSPGGAVPAARR